MDGVNEFVRTLNFEAVDCQYLKYLMMSDNEYFEVGLICYFLRVTLVLRSYENPFLSCEPNLAKLMFFIYTSHNIWLVYFNYLLPYRHLNHLCFAGTCDRFS